MHVCLTEAFFDFQERNHSRTQFSGVPLARNLCPDARDVDSSHLDHAGTLDKTDVAWRLVAAGAEAQVKTG